MEIEPVSGIEFRGLGHLKSSSQDHGRHRRGKSEDISPGGPNAPEELFRTRVARIPLATGEGDARLRGFREPDEPG